MKMYGLMIFLGAIIGFALTLCGVEFSMALNASKEEAERIKKAEEMKERMEFNRAVQCAVNNAMDSRESKINERLIALHTHIEKKMEEVAIRIIDADHEQRKKDV